MKIYNDYKRLSRNYSLLTDEYEYTMAAAYLDNNMQDVEAVFDIFFRKIPHDGGYAIMAGLDKIIPFVSDLHFDEQALDYFRKKNYSSKFIDYLKAFHFHGDIYAVPDGTPVFPNEPILTVKAPIIEAQIMETALLSIINGAMDHMTAARRIIEATPKNVDIMEFGARRADGMEAALDSSIYGIMAGCVGTSNALAAHFLNQNALGTMAHSFVEAFDSELEAFIAFAKEYPNNCILLVDTYNTLKSGIPNAIKTFNYMKENHMPLDHIGIRIDSGDLAYLSKEARNKLDKAGFSQAKICLSNSLTAEAIESLVTEGACFDLLGVGENISKTESRMGCIYKEVAIKKDNMFKPTIKLSSDPEKITNPGFKDLYRAFDKDTGYALADIMVLKDEEISQNHLTIVDTKNYLKRKIIDNYKLVKLQKTIFLHGKLVYDDPTIEEKRRYCDEMMMTLYPEIKRNRLPHTYYVDGTIEYVMMKNDLIIKINEMVGEENNGI